MKISRLVPYVTGATVALTILAGCSPSGSQSQGTFPGFMGSSAIRSDARHGPTPNFVQRNPVRHRNLKKSWMDPAAVPDNLLYIANTFASSVDVYSWRKFKAVGSITGLGEPYALCVDKAQDVYVPDFETENIYEYAHGGTSPIKTLSESYGAPIGCAVDPTTGNLAVSIFSGTPGILIYAGASGTPTLYTSSNITAYWPPGYDSSGNLFVEGEATSGDALDELPAGESTFTIISLPFSIGFPGNVAWDGKYVAVGDQSSNTVYQITVSGSTATEQGSTSLGGASDVFQFFVPKFGNGKINPQGTRIVAADYGESEADKWLYPAGGTARKTITGLTNPEGAVVSKGRQ
jgi:hypothetical protein